MVNILALSGSLRAASSNTAVVEAARRLAPPGVQVTIYEGLGALPFFNPDLAEDAVLPAPVQAFRRLAVQSDGLLISSPEYAGGVSGLIKNGLDWLVGAEFLAGAPVMVVNASQRGVSADAHLKLTLQTMSLPVIEVASIVMPLLGRGLDSDGIIADPDLSVALAEALVQFVAAIKVADRLRA